MPLFFVARWGRAPDSPIEVFDDVTVRYAALLAYAEQVLGRCELVEDCSWGHGWSAVLRVRDAAGAAWFVKRHRDPQRYDAEVTAYQRWVPALGDQAPRLRAHDGAQQAIVLSAVPGRPAPWPEPGQDSGHADGARRAAEAGVQRLAGVLLRRLHGAQAAQPWDELGAVKMAQFERLAPLAAGLLTGRELGFVRAEVRALAGRSAGAGGADGVGAALRVACHRDYNVRNWLIDEDDGDCGAAATRLYVIDFEWAGLDVWVRDLVRLSFGPWVDRPDLQEAFLDGYGRRLDAADRALLAGCSALTAVWLVVKARESGQASFEQATRRVLHRLMAEAA